MSQIILTVPEGGGCPEQQDILEILAECGIDLSTAVSVVQNQGDGQYLHDDGRGNVTPINTCELFPNVPGAFNSLLTHQLFEGADGCNAVNWPMTNVFRADAYGMSEAASAAVNSQALADAIGDAQTTGGAVWLPAGQFDINNYVFNEDDVILIGSGMPSPSADRSQLLGGTVFVGGGLRLNNRKRIQIRDMGIDMSDGSGDAIQSGGNAIDEQHIKITNFSSLGNSTAGSHGVSLTSGSHNLVDNVDVYRMAHGVVFRCSKSRASNIMAEDCEQSTVTIKAIDTINAQHNVMANIQGIGTAPFNQGAVIVEAHNGSICSHNLISNVIVQNCTFGLQIKTVAPGATGQCIRNNVSDFTVDTVQFDGVRIQGDGVSRNNMSAIHIFGAGAYGFRNLSPSQAQYINDSHVTAAAQGLFLGQFDEREINSRDGRLIRVGLTNNLPIPDGVFTEIPFEFSQNQTDVEFWDSVTDPERLISPVSDVYEVTAHIVFVSNATGRRSVRIVRSQDGQPVALASVNAVAGDVTVVNASWLQNMNVGDFFTVEVFQNSGGPLDLDNQMHVRMNRQ